MLTMKRLFVGTCCALASLPTIAGNWVNSGINLQIAEYINTTDVDTFRNVLGTWVLDLYPVRPGKPDYSLSWREFDCRKRTTRTTEMTVFDSFGRVTGESEGAPHGEECCLDRSAKQAYKLCVAAREKQHTVGIALMKLQ